MDPQARKLSVMSPCWAALEASSYSLFSFTGRSPSSSRTRVSKLAWIVARDSAASFSMRGTPVADFLEPGLEVASQCRALATALQVERFDRTLHRLQGDIDSRPGIVFLLRSPGNLGPLQNRFEPEFAVELEPLAQPAQLTD